MKKIQNIVVPIDFSTTSRNAYHYARSLAKTLHATITVVNVKDHSIMTSDVMITSFPIDDKHQLIKDIEEFIVEEDISENNPVEKSEVKIQILRGDPVSVLTELSESETTDLIVIGTTGFADVLTKIFGSTSIKLSNQAHCPVILVPRDARWHSIEKIMYASNYDSMSPKVMQRMIDFVMSLNASVHFINVKDFDPPLETKQTEINLSNLLSSVHNDLSFEEHTIYGNNTVEELKNYSEDKHIDIIAFVSKHRNFWEGLIHKSITQNMSFSVDIPMMVIHIDDNK
jgi:nucleotide-binding universal stress UspA family protein